MIDYLGNKCAKNLCKRTAYHQKCGHMFLEHSVDSVKTNKHIFISLPSVSNTILVFHNKCYDHIRGVECRWVDRNRDFEPMSGFIACCQHCDRLFKIQDGGRPPF